MRLEQVTVQGFMDSFAGKRVTLPLRDLPDGLIAIVGTNGAGKTTLLGAGPACLYREPMERKFSLESYAKDRYSFLEAEWSIGADLYIARLSIDGIKGGSAAAIRRQGDPKPINDGKVSTYDRVIADLFDPLHIFRATAFATQNKRGSFIRAGKGERRDIVNAALTLDRWVAMSDTAKKSAAEVEKVRVRLKADIDTLERTTAPAVVDELQRQRAALVDAATAAATRRQQIEHEIGVIEQKLATMGDDVAAHAAAASRVAHLAEGRAFTERELQAHLDTQAAAGDDERRTLDALTVEHARKSKSNADRRTAIGGTLIKEIEGINADLATKWADIDKRLKGNEDVQAMRADIEAAVAALATLKPQLETLRAEADRLGAQERQLATDLAAAERALTAFTKPQAELDRARVDAGLLGHVPCHGQPEFAGCQFLVNATAAAARIADLEATVAGVVAAIATRDRLAGEKGAADQALETTRESIDGLAAKVKDAEALAIYAESLAAYTARVQELTLARTAAEADAMARVGEADARHAAALQQLVDEKKALDEALDVAVTALQQRVDARRTAALDRQDGLEAAVATAVAAHEAAVQELQQLAAGQQETTALRTYLGQLRTDRDNAVTARATAEADAAAVAARLADLDAKAQQLTFLQARMRRLDTELLEWQQLQRALDRDGLPALETDQAGPEIAATTNLILQDCFDSRFSVELVTQVAKADGKGMKDDLTLLVTDNHSGEVRDISDLSGGEEVIVAEAFMNALAIFVSVRSQTPPLTLFRDEADGGLTKENRQRYMRMLRRVLEISGAKQIVFVSHDPDVQVMADAQVRIADGQVSTVLPPYRAA
jgi:DNA repair exonuclease SbcCD ATPase subunit